MACMLLVFLLRQILMYELVGFFFFFFIHKLKPQHSSLTAALVLCNSDGSFGLQLGARV